MRAGCACDLAPYESPIPHFQYDVFNVAPPAVDPVHNRFRRRVTFQTDVYGSIGSLLAPVEPTVPPIAFPGRRNARATARHPASASMATVLVPVRDTP